MPRKDKIQAAASAAHDSSLIDDVLKAIAPLVAGATVKAATAREKAAPLADQAKERLVPVAETAKEKATPLVGQAKERLAPVADTAMHKATPLVDQAKDHGQHAIEVIAPLAAAAAASASQAREKAVPLVDQAAKNVAPHVESARAKVQEDLVPMLVDLLHQAEEHPAVAEAAQRSKATVAALRGEIAVPEPKQRNVGGTLVKLAAASAVLAAAAVAVRQFLGSKDDEWTAHQPSDAYVNRSEDEVAQPAAEGSDVDLDAAETFADVDTPAADAPDVTSEPAPEAVMSDEGGIVDDAETTAEDLAVLNEYGEGSYVGDEPPAEFTIKGNERSMKFHTPESGGYERTIADVWFNSVEAAERAGFTLAQR